MACLAIAIGAEPINKKANRYICVGWPRGRSLRPGAAIIAPVNAPLPDPEVASAIVQLSDRRRDRWSLQPVGHCRPLRLHVLAQGQLDGFAAATRATEASPFIDTIAHNRHLARHDLIRCWMCRCYPDDHVASRDDAGDLEAFPQEFYDHAIHPIRSRKGSTSPRPQYSSLPQTGQPGLG